MPAANIMEIHDAVENSGCSPGLPRRMEPNFEKAITKTKPTKMVPNSTKAQPRLLMTQLNDSLANAAKLLGPIRPQATMPATTTTIGMTTAQVIGALSSSAADLTVSSWAAERLSPLCSASISSASSLVADGAESASRSLSLNGCRSFSATSETILRR